MSTNMQPLGKGKTTYAQYGVECGEGWAKLYQPLIDLCNDLGVEILQVKEKFGGLRFYAGAGGKHAKAVNMAIQTAEEASYHTCEDCGLQDSRKICLNEADDPTSSPWEGKVTTGTSSTSRWIRTLCQKCRDTFDDRRRAEGFKDWVKETPELADQRLRTRIRKEYPEVAAEAIIATMGTVLGGGVMTEIHLPTLFQRVIALADAYKEAVNQPVNGPVGPKVFNK